MKLDTSEMLLGTAETEIDVAVSVSLMTVTTELKLDVLEGNDSMLDGIDENSTEDITIKLEENNILSVNDGRELSLLSGMVKLPVLDGTIEKFANVVGIELPVEEKDTIAEDEFNRLPVVDGKNGLVLDESTGEAVDVNALLDTALKLLDAAAEDELERLGMGSNELKAKLVAAAVELPNELSSPELGSAGGNVLEAGPISSDELGTRLLAPALELCVGKPELIFAEGVLK